MAVVTVHNEFGAQENKVCHSIFSQSICHEVMGPDAIILVFFSFNVNLKPALLFHLHQDAL